MKLVGILAAALLVAACEELPQVAAPQRVIGWKKVGAWSGRGNLLSETFTSDTGSFRIQWQATNETTPGKGTLKVAFRSADSGRVIAEPVDHHGAGRNTSYMSDLVRWYYLTIESANVDWSVALEEPIVGQTVSRLDP